MTALGFFFFLWVFFFFNDTATTEIYTLSLHDALPISQEQRQPDARGGARRGSARHRLGDCGGPAAAGERQRRAPPDSVLAARAAARASGRRHPAVRHARVARCVLRDRP